MLRKILILISWDTMFNFFFSFTNNPILIYLNDFQVGFFQILFYYDLNVVLKKRFVDNTKDLYHCNDTYFSA